MFSNSTFPPIPKQPYVESDLIGRTVFSASVTVNLRYFKLSKPTVNNYSEYEYATN